MDCTRVCSYEIFTPPAFKPHCNLFKITGDRQRITYVLDSILHGLPPACGCVRMCACVCLQYLKPTVPPGSQKRNCCFLIDSLPSLSVSTPVPALKSDFIFLFASSLSLKYLHVAWVMWAILFRFTLWRRCLFWNVSSACVSVRLRARKRLVAR